MERDAAGLGVVQAASRLGISVDAVRKRLRRGTLTAYKVDGAWRIVLDDPAPPGTDSDRPDDRTERAETVQDAGLSIIEQLRSEVAFLRQLTEHQAGVIARQSDSLAELAQRPALPAGKTEGPAETSAERPQEPAPPPKRRGWLDRLLRR